MNAILEKVSLSIIENLQLDQCAMGYFLKSGNSWVSNRLSKLEIRKGDANYRSESGLEFETGTERSTGPTD